MGIPFNEKMLLFPPRPKGAVSPDTISKYPGWSGQLKFNGTRTLIYVLPDGTIELWNRKKQLHKAYQITASMRDSIASLGLEHGKFHVLDGELLHSKTPHVKDRIVLWDVLVHAGEYLIGSTYQDRYEKLKTLLGSPTRFESETKSELALKVNQNLWLAELFTENVASRFKEKIHLDEIEGLVLKDRNGRLEFGLLEENNGVWHIRVRKPHANYSF